MKLEIRFYPIANRLDCWDDEKIPENPTYGNTELITTDSFASHREGEYVMFIDKKPEGYLGFAQSTTSASIVMNWLFVTDTYKSIAGGGKSQISLNVGTQLLMALCQNLTRTKRGLQFSSLPDSLRFYNRFFERLFPKTTIMADEKRSFTIPKEAMEEYKLNSSHTEDLPSETSNLTLT